MNHEEIMQQLQLGIQAYQNKNLDGAEAIFKHILAVNLKEPNSLHFLGCIYKDRGQLQQAIDLIQASIQVDGSNPIPFINLGKILVVAGQHENAAAVFQESLKRNHQILEAWFCLGNAFREIEKTEEAKQAYRNALQLNPFHAGAAGNFGILLKDNNELDEAEEVLRRALKSNPEDIKCLLNLGVVLKEKGEVKEVIASYRKAIEVKPDFAQAYLNLGIVLKEEGEVEEAGKYLLSAVKIEPTLRTGFYQLFDLLLDADRENEEVLLNNLSSAILLSISSQEIIAFGDSHVGVFEGIPGFEKVWVGAATAYNLVKSKSFTKGREKISERLESASPHSSSVLLSFGEVDCRSNILKYCIKNGESIDLVCRNVVSRYFEFVDEIIAKGFAVLLCGPYGSGSDHNNQGNAKERYYASLQMEEILCQGARERGIPFFSLHGVLTNSALQTTRVEFFADGLHFSGHKTNKISSDVKCMVLSRLLDAVNKTHSSSLSAASPDVKDVSLLGEKSLCLLDIFSNESPEFYRLGVLPDARARAEVLSQASKSIVLDLDACLNVKVLHFSLAASNADGVDVWGLDNSGNKTVAAIKFDAQSQDDISCLRLNAVFPPFLMLRYLVITCPEGLLASLLDFDVRGNSFVFS